MYTHIRVYVSICVYIHTIVCDCSYTSHTYVYVCAFMGMYVLVFMYISACLPAGTSILEIPALRSKVRAGLHRVLGPFTHKL